MNYSGTARVQVVVYSENAIKVETLLLSEDEQEFFKLLLNWMRSNDFSDFHITKHNTSIRWNITYKDGKDSFKTLANHV